MAVFQIEKMNEFEEVLRSEGGTDVEEEHFLELRCRVEVSIIIFSIIFRRRCFEQYR